MQVKDKVINRDSEFDKSGAVGHVRADRNMIPNLRGREQVKKKPQKAAVFVSDS